MARRPTPLVIAGRLQFIVAAVVIPDVTPAPDCYISTYRDYLERFARVTEARAWATERVIEHVGIVYTWMRRHPSYVVDLAVAEQFAESLNDGADEERLMMLASRLVNNSMVGGSKFLHFYDPVRFPITDDWLRKNLSGMPGHSVYGLDFYRNWVSGVRLVEAEHAARAVKWASKAFGYDVTPVRALEGLAFYFIKSLGEQARLELRTTLREQFANAA